MPYTATRRVEFSDTDAAGIMHFTAFFRLMEQAEHELLRHLGLSVLMESIDGRLSWPRVAAQCDFVSAVKFEDVVQITVHIARMGEKSVTYEFRFACEGRPVAAGRTTAVCCRMEHGRPPLSVSIPDDIRAKLATMVEPADAGH